MEIIGQQFGRLTVLEKAESSSKHPKYKCQCSCGNIKTVRKDHIRSGSTTSCGCAAIEANTTHGKANSKIYHVWENILGRCNHPNNSNYKHYGGRGIKNEFKNFEDFYSYVGNIPKGMEIDRIDVNKNYCKGNLRIVTKSQNGINRHKYRNRKCSSTYKGVSKNKRTGKWESYITKEGKRRHLGRFKDEWDAAKAYNYAAMELFGQYAVLNVKIG